MSDTKRCSACFGRGSVGESWVDRDDAGMPTRICFGPLHDCPKCAGSGRVPKPAKPAPIQTIERQEMLFQTEGAR